MSKSCVWMEYRKKIAQVTSLEALIVRRGCYIKGYGLPFKTRQGYLAYHRYNQPTPNNSPDVQK